MKIALKKIVRGPEKMKAQRFSEAFEKLAGEFEMNTSLRIAHFWGQMLHETGGLKWMFELGGRKYFEKYDGRKDLGNVKPGDGYRFRGRGLIHLTGRYNYEKYGKLIGADLINNPDQAAEPGNALKIALIYWSNKDLNKYADLNAIKPITKRINGGYNGLTDRERWFKKVLTILSEDGIL